MKGALCKQNSWPPGGGAGKLNGRFNAFGAAIGEVHAIEAATDTLNDPTAVRAIGITAWKSQVFATSGRTVGARVMGLRVVGRRGTRVRWAPALLRAVFCAAFPIGLFWCAVSRESRSVQDVVLRTSVIHDWPVARSAPTLLDTESRRVSD